MTRGAQAKFHSMHIPIPPGVWPGELAHHQQAEGNMRVNKLILSAFVGIPLVCGVAPSSAADNSFACAGLPDWSTLRTALKQAVADETSGLDFNMWATLVSRDGTVCAVAFSGDAFTAQWLGSRV